MSFMLSGCFGMACGEFRRRNDAVHLVAILEFIGWISLLIYTPSVLYKFKYCASVEISEILLQDIIRYSGKKSDYSRLVSAASCPLSRHMSAVASNRRREAPC
jgi:hypothetical protein